MKRTKVEFEFNGYEVVAVGVVYNESIISSLSISYPDLDESDYPDGDDKACIREMAEELLVESAFCPEMD